MRKKNVWQLWRLSAVKQRSHPVALQVVHPAAPAVPVVQVDPVAQAAPVAHQATLQAAVLQVVITINRQQEAMHHRTIAVQRKVLLEQVAQRKAIHMTHMMMSMMIYTWMAIMILTGMTWIVIMPMVWMTQWMNLTRIGKYGR